MHDVIAWKDLLITGLSEDDWQWDWTTLGALARDPERKVSARILAKSDGIWAASGLVDAVNEVAALPMARSRLRDGDAFRSGTVVSEWSGPARQLLALERPFLNLASYVSGIATATHELVELVRKACPARPPRVVPTRKILPAYRDLAVHGVRAGGGFAHRTSLSGGVLIKENHIAAAGGIPAAIAGARAQAPHGMKIEIEVTSEAELREALASGADAVLLDNFTPDQVRSAVKVAAAASPRPVIEVSGGLSVATISSYAIEGVDVLSVGSLTHSVKSVDLSLLVDK